MNNTPSPSEPTTSRQAGEDLPQLIARHLDWVYSLCQRSVHDTALAEDATQNVFMILTKKAASLPQGVNMPGWLFKTARYCCRWALRDENVRRRNELAAAKMRHDTGAPQPADEELLPLLDEQLARLSKADRKALLLRYYERRSLREVGAALGISEEAAKKRVRRAVEKLRTRMAVKQIPLGAEALTALLADKLVQPAPAKLATAILAHTSHSSTAIGLSTSQFNLIGKASFKAMTSGKVALAVACTSVVLLPLILFHLDSIGRPGPISKAFPHGIVFLPNHKPAANVRVYLQMYRHFSPPFLYWVNARLQRPTGPLKELYVPKSMTKTGAGGQFTLPPQKDSYVVAVVCQWGYAAVSAAELVADPDITLKPWCIVSGRLHLRGASDHWRYRVVAQLAGYSGSNPSYDTVEIQSSAVADRKGRFRLNYVPSGLVIVSLFSSRGAVKLPGAQPSLSAAQKLEKRIKKLAYRINRHIGIMLTPGQKMTMNIGGDGRTLIGKIFFPPLWTPTGQVVTGTLSPKWPAIPYPDDWHHRSRLEQARWWKRWIDSPAGLKYQATQITDFYAHVQDDGTFKILDVPPGDYTFGVGLPGKWKTIKGNFQPTYPYYGTGAVTVRSTPKHLPSWPEIIGPFRPRRAPQY